MAEATPISTRDNVGAALRFARENWQFVLTAAAVAAGGQGLILLLGPSLIWMLAVIVAVVGAHTALTSAALGVPRPLTGRLPGDSARVGAAMAMIGFFLAIFFIMATFVAMSVLIAPYSVEVKAAGEDQVALRAIMDRAVQNDPGVITWTMAGGAVLLLALTTRFYLAAPATIDRQRITLFESWRMTRGNFFRIVGARLLLLGPAFILVSALQTLIAGALGVAAGDPVAMLSYSSGNPAGFALFYSVSIFLQITIFSALEAGLSANLYRSLNRPAA